MVAGDHFLTIARCCLVGGCGDEWVASKDRVTRKFRNHSPGPVGGSAGPGPNFTMSLRCQTGSKSDWTYKWKQYVRYQRQSL